MVSKMSSINDPTNLDPLGLRRLPPRRAPDELWPAIESRLDRAPAPVARARWPWTGAIAAALMIALVPPIVWWQQDADVTMPLPAADLVTLNDAESGVLDTARAQLRSARRLSALLEDELNRARGHVLSPADMDALVWIEAELSLTDDLLGEDPDNLELWHQRIALLGRMQARYEQNNWRRQMQLTRL